MSFAAIWKIWKWQDFIHCPNNPFTLKSLFSFFHLKGVENVGESCCQDH